MYIRRSPLEHEEVIVYVVRTDRTVMHGLFFRCQLCYYTCSCLTFAFGANLEYTHRIPIVRPAAEASESCDDRRSMCIALSRQEA